MSIWEWVSNCVYIRGDQFRFGLVFIKKKVIKTSFFFYKTNRNRFKLTGFRSVILGKQPVQTDQLGFFRFGSVFPGLGLVWFGFFGFRLIKPNWTGQFFKNSNRFNRFFFMIRLLFFDFLDLIGFFIFFLTPNLSICL
jgi:hypothetical protein